MAKSFYIEAVNSLVHRRALEEIEHHTKDGKTKVTISHAKETRGQQQNRIMHMWFADIANQSAYSKSEIGGRCKLTYFVPVLLASESVKAQGFQDVWHAIDGVYSYEQKIAMLGSSVINSTSLLGVKEFAQALTEMRYEESKNYTLTDPEMQGYEI